MRYGRLAVLLLLGACAPLIETPDGRTMRASSDEFQSYSSEVFRRHNAAAVAIVDALDAAGDAPIVATLELADATMLRECSPLNRLAAARRDGATLSTGERLAAANAVPSCDRATRRAETLIGEAGR